MIEEDLDREHREGGEEEEEEEGGGQEEVDLMIGEAAPVLSPR